MDPRELIPIEGVGVVYPSATMKDEWGELKANSGMLILSNWMYINLSEPKNIKDDLITGEGWELHISEGWIIDSTDDRYELKK